MKKEIFLKTFSKPQIGFEIKARAAEKEEHIGYM